MFMMFECMCVRYYWTFFAATATSLLCCLKCVFHPVLTSHHQAPSSLLEALEQHLASLEGKKIKEASTVSRYLNQFF